MLSRSSSVFVCFGIADVVNERSEILLQFASMGISCGVLGRRQSCTPGACFMGRSVGVPHVREGVRCRSHGTYHYGTRGYTGPVPVPVHFCLSTYVHRVRHWRACRTQMLWVRRERADRTHDRADKLQKHSQMRRSLP